MPPEPSPWERWTTEAVADLRSRNLLRQLRPVAPTLSSSATEVYEDDLAAWVAGADPPARSYPPLLPAAAATGATTTSGAPYGAAGLRTVKLYSLNDYLGLASHPEVCAAAAAAASRHGMGPRSSALVGGYTHSHRQLEQALAQLKQAQDCLLFPTGFAANLSVMAALGGAEDVAIYSDELNHASIIDGARLASRAGATLQVYRHNDLAHLDALLSAQPPEGQRRHRRSLVVTDSLFSMDGDFADLTGLAALRRKHGFLLVVDEAHATLAYGEHGGGVAEAQGVADAVDVHVGTLSKAFGALGGFAACSAQTKAYLLNRGRPVVYSTALPLPVVAAAQAALVVSQREWWRRRHLQSLVQRLGDALGVAAQSAIVPLVIGPEEATLRISGRLLQQGFHVPAIRPPTVPPGTCRLRVSLTAAHSYEDVDALAAAIRSCDIKLLNTPAGQQPTRSTAAGLPLSSKL